MTEAKKPRVSLAFLYDATLAPGHFRMAVAPDQVTLTLRCEGDTDRVLRGFWDRYTIVKTLPACLFDRQEHRLVDVDMEALQACNLWPGRR